MSAYSQPQTPYKQLRINPDRLKADFDALSSIGSTGDGGIHRPALGSAHLEARRWFRQQVMDAGLEFHQDTAGNHSALLRRGPQEAKTLLFGSHLDSVPYGGRYDGALGVLAALEVLRTVHEAGFSLPVNLEAIDFTDEEGTLVGLLGSSALASKLTPQDLQHPPGGRQTFVDALERAGLEESQIFTATRPAEELAGYIELHIEQGPRLLQAGADIGIVTGIVGITDYQLTYTGRADHSGTTPMTARLDAAQGASTFLLAVRQLILDEFPDCVANVGKLNLAPGAFNIVPERVQLGLEFRSSDAKQLEQLEAALLEQAEDAARRFSLQLKTEFLEPHMPTPTSPEIQAAIAQACEDLGLKAIKMASGAGHDAQSLAGLCPSGMIFVPSEAGASHSARELTTWQDCINGANVLLQAALNFLSKQDA